MNKSVLSNKKARVSALFLSAKRFIMAGIMALIKTCPWWMGYSIDNPLRRMIHRPEKMLAPYLKPGMTAMDLGAGFGMFTIAMAELVGPTGKVIAVDLQEKMLAEMKRRAKKQGVIDRIQPVLCKPDDLLIKDQVGFVLTMWMLHEVREPKKFLNQLKDCLKPESRFLIVEPKYHVSQDQFQKILALAEQVGLKKIETPKIRISMAALLGLAA